MIDKAHLQGKTIGIKVDSLAVAVPATVSLVEQDGLWLVSDNLTAHLAKGGGGLPVGLKTPAVYVPFSQVSWLIAENK
jgi:hypothetical protein